MLSNDSCCWTPQVQLLSFWSRALRGSVFSARELTYLACWFTKPKNRHTSPTLVGGGIWRMAWTLSGSRCIRLLHCPTTCPIHLTDVTEKTHFSRYKVTPACWIRCKTQWRRWSSSSLVLTNTNISSIMQTVLCWPFRIWCIPFWKCSGAEVMPKGNLWKQYLPNGVINVV